MPDGFQKFVVHNLAELEVLLMHNRVYAGEVAANVSTKNRKLIVERAAVRFRNTLCHRCMGRRLSSRFASASTESKSRPRSRSVFDDGDSQGGRRVACLRVTRDTMVAEEVKAGAALLTGAPVRCPHLAGAEHQAHQVMFGGSLLNV